MAIDLTGGIDPAREYVFATRPDDPEMRDSVSFWVVDDQGEVALPRVGIEAVAANWDAHDVQVNVALGDGRVLRLRENGASHSPRDADGRPAILGAGGLAFTCVEPFRTWTMTYSGKAVQTSSADLVAGRKHGPTVDVDFAVQARMAVPPWVQGTMSAQAAQALTTSIEGSLMGGARYEQLFRATGTITVDGGPPHRFGGSGLRIRRQGVRRLAGFWGHCWQSALFPDGRAFGYIAYPPRADGQPTFNEGFVFDGTHGGEDGGHLIPARVVQAPWLTRLRATGEDVSLVLETSRGTVRIDGETVLSTHDIHHDDEMFSSTALREEMPSFPALQQAAVRYRWDDQQAYGMLERSNPLESLSRD